MRFRPSVSRPRPGSGGTRTFPRASWKGPVPAVLAIALAAASLMTLSLAALHPRPIQSPGLESPAPWKPAKVRLPILRRPAAEPARNADLSLSLVADASPAGPIETPQIEAASPHPPAPEPADPEPRVEPSPPQTGASKGMPEVAPSQAGRSGRAVLITSVSYDAGDGRGERVSIRGNRFFEPNVFGVDGPNPYGARSRIVVDIPDALPLQEDRMPRTVNGRLVHAIRHFYHHDTQTLRLVLDLTPADSYEADQVFLQDRNLYSLILSDGASSSGGRPIPTPATPAPEAHRLERHEAADPLPSPPATHRAQVVAPGSGLFRVTGRDLSIFDVQAMLKRHGLHSTCAVYNADFCNPQGDFPNRFRMCGSHAVCDEAAGLMWQKRGSEDPVPLERAGAYIRELNRTAFAGFQDWRLPTLEELLSLMEGSWRNGDLFIDPAFHPAQRSCWSVDTLGEDRAWKAQFHLGYAMDGPAEERNWVRAVRSLSGPLQAGHPPGPEGHGTAGDPTSPRLVAR